MSTASTLSTITVDSTQFLNFAKNLIPVLSLAIPQISQNSQLVTLAESSAQSLISLISQIPTNTGTITSAQQASLLAQIYQILAGSEFTSPEWKIQV